MRFDIQVDHPRYFLPPKVGMHIAPHMLAMAARPCIGRMMDEGYDFDLIDAHYFYPDGVAAALLGKMLRIDVNTRSKSGVVFPQQLTITRGP